MKLKFYNEENLNISDQYSSKIIQGLQDTIFIFTYSRDKGCQIKFISSSIYQMFEFLPENKIVNPFKPVMERIHADDITSIYESLAECEQNEKPWQTEFRAQLPERGLCWFKIYAPIEKLFDGSVIFNGRISDITVIKNLENELKISTERSNIFQEITNLGIWDWDLKTDTIFHSPQSLKILELEEGHICKKQKEYQKIIHPDDLGNFYSLLQEHFENKTSQFEIFYRTLTAAGKYKWILSKGRITERNPEGLPARITGTCASLSPLRENTTESTYINEANKNILIQYQAMFSNLHPLIKNLHSLIEGINLKKNFRESRMLLANLINTSDDLEQTIKYLLQKN